MRTLILILLFLPLASFAQKKQFTFFSDYQIDKTYNGSKKVSYHKTTIIFSDPKSITIAGTEFEKLPRGYMSFNYEGLDQFKDDIIFLGSKSNNDIYAITNSRTDNDLIWVIKGIAKISGKTYSHIIMWGKSDENDLERSPKYATVFFCTLAN